MSKNLLAIPFLVIGMTNQGWSRDREVTVSGNCFRTVTPDRGAIILTTEAQSKDLQTAAREATDSYNRVRDAVQRLKLEDTDLRTVEYTLSEIREWEKNHMVSRGFRARMGLRVASSQIQRLGEVIAIGARENVRDVGQLTTYLSEDKKKKEQFACLQEAAEDAKARGEKLATSLGAKLGEVISISETGGFQRPEPQPVMMMEKAARASDVAPPTVEAGREELRLTVQVQFALK
jgi:uncharacterized protein YggE